MLIFFVKISHFFMKFWWIFLKKLCKKLCKKWANYLQKLHKFFSKQFSQFGRVGLQIFCPCVTKSVLKSNHNFSGKISLSFISVSSGVFVWTYPHRLQILCTCTSTQIAGLLKPFAKTRLAVFLPTPLNFVNSSIVSGVFPL